MICRVLNENNFLKSKAVNTVAQELFQLWTWCNADTISSSAHPARSEKFKSWLGNSAIWTGTVQANRGRTFFKKEASVMRKNSINCSIFLRR